MELDIKKTKEDTIIIDMIGKFTIEDEHTFQLELNKLLKGKVKSILFNFSQLIHIDSTGVGSIIKLMNLAKSSDVNLYLYSLPEHILKIFQSAYLDTFLNIKTQEEMGELFSDIKFN